MYGHANRREEDKTNHIPDAMSIYDVIRELVEAQRWPDEGAKLRRMDAINEAQRNQLFGTEGTYRL